jgi:hypothetical protein
VVFVEHLVCLIYPKLTTFGLENYVEMYDPPEHKVLENTLLEHKGERETAETYCGTLSVFNLSEVNHFWIRKLCRNVWPLC